MKKWKINVIGLLVLFTISCNDIITPKPEGYVRLEYPTAQYVPFKNDCHFTFQYNQFANIEKDSMCWFTLSYPKMKAKLYLTYYPITPETLPTYIKQSEKLVFEHTKMASGIDPKFYVNNEAKVYGTFYELMGESATNFQMYLTDSTHHFLAGSFYFRAQPKPDSLKPAVEYIKKDLKELMETTRWK